MRFFIRFAVQFVFSQIADLPFDYDVLQTIMRHIKLLETYLPHRVVNNEMKKHIAFYLKGMRNSKQTLIAVMNSRDVEEIVSLVEIFLTNNA